LRIQGLSWGNPKWDVNLDGKKRRAQDAAKIAAVYKMLESATRETLNSLKRQGTKGGGDRKFVCVYVCVRVRV